MADDEIVKTALWQFNEAVSLLREAREHIPQTMGRLTVEIERGLPAIQAALEALAAGVAAGPQATPPDDEAKRFDLAVDILLNGGLLAPHMDDFWAFCDGEIDEDEARRRFP